MSRILKRPMFRRGGSTNTGIMSGIVDRTKHQENPFPGSTIDRKAIEGNTAVLESILRQYTPKTRLPIGEFGLNLASGMTLTDALKKPYARFTQADDAREAAIKGGASKIAISKALESPKIGTLKQGRNTSNQTLYGVPPGKTGYFSSKQLIEAQGLITPIDDRMITLPDGTIMPYEEYKTVYSNKNKARAIVASVNTLDELKNSMIRRLDETPTGAVGVVYGVIEGFSDQFSQASDALGFTNQNLKFDPSKSEELDAYLDKKGITKGAANFAAMKSSVINLAYILAKIKEPLNPRLSEGDIIRQMNRISFGASKAVFANSLNQIYKDELISASGQITGYGLNPDDFFGTGAEGSTEEGKGTIKKDSEKSGDIFDLGL
tara:strand:+ start:903 stop:2036 length:1134 start_codon:yes stop_codon:yes gene_type:complete